MDSHQNLECNQIRVQEHGLGKQAVGLIGSRKDWGALEDLIEIAQVGHEEPFQNTSME